MLRAGELRVITPRPEELLWQLLCRSWPALLGVGVGLGRCVCEREVGGDWGSAA